MFKTYFSARPILSKKALFNTVLSDRSDGKTFDCKARALEDFEANGDTTIYMRRYDTEITPKMYNTFFNDTLSKDKYKRFNSWQYKYSKEGVQISKDDGKTWKQCVYFIPLSMAGKLKSQIDIDHVHTIDFDEYVPLNGVYLKDEMTLLLEFWKSIDRDRDTTQLIILGNKITTFLPVFDYFNIGTGLVKDKLKLYRNGSLAVQIYSNKEHREQRAKSKFKQLITGTSYEDYDNGGVLEALYIPTTNTDRADYFLSYRTTIGEGSIWTRGTQYIVSTERRKDGVLIVDKPYDDPREQLNIEYPRIQGIFRRAYKTNTLFFTSPEAQHTFAPLMTKCY